MRVTGDISVSKAQLQLITEKFGNPGRSPGIRGAAPAGSGGRTLATLAAVALAHAGAELAPVRGAGANRHTLKWVESVSL